MTNGGVSSQEPVATVAADATAKKKKNRRRPGKGGSYLIGRKFKEHVAERRATFTADKWGYFVKMAIFNHKMLCVLPLDELGNTKAKVSVDALCVANYYKYKMRNDTNAQAEEAVVKEVNFGQIDVRTLRRLVSDYDAWWERCLCELAQEEEPLDTNEVLFSASNPDNSANNFTAGSDPSEGPSSIVGGKPTRPTRLAHPFHAGPDS